MIDELPVGASTTNQMDEFAENQTSAPESTAPLQERLLSKVWSVRAVAYDELATLFREADSPQDQIFKEHSSSWKKFLADANPGSLEKALDMLQVFIDKAESKLVAVCQNEIIKILIEKCVGHMKPTIKTKSLECFAFIFEVTEQFDESMETVIESLNSKVQKVFISILMFRLIKQL
jgi:hypothetical protein